jgi:hypothetical protein
LIHVREDVPDVKMMNKRQTSGSQKTVSDQTHRWRCLCLAVLATSLFLPGCKTPFNRNQIEEPIRKQAQADPFPTAKQVGLE